MGSVVVIADVHGSLHWKDKVKARKENDHVVFLGDYFDLRGEGPFASSQAQNFLEICEFARSTPNTSLLVGNHDYAYFTYAGGSPFDPDEVVDESLEYKKVLRDNADLLKIVSVHRDFPKPLVLSHGGVTNTFMRRFSLERPEEINQLWVVAPDVFKWAPTDPATGKASAPNGDDPWQAPLWVRTNALKEDGLRGCDQVVGHTRTDSLKWRKTSQGDNFLLTCTLDDQQVVLAPEKDG